jgi:hypothetical protein
MSERDATLEINHTSGARQLLTLLGRTSHNATAMVEVNGINLERFQQMALH